MHVYWTTGENSLKQHNVTTSFHTTP